MPKKAIKYVIVGVDYSTKFITGFKIFNKRIQAQKQLSKIKSKNPNVRVRILPVEGEDDV